MYVTLSQKLTLMYVTLSQKLTLMYVTLSQKLTLMYVALSQKLTLMYVTLSKKYKVDDNHKTNIDTLEHFFVNCKLMTAAAYKLQRTSKT